MTALTSEQRDDRVATLRALLADNARYGGGICDVWIEELVEVLATAEPGEAGLRAATQAVDEAERLITHGGLYLSPGNRDRIHEKLRAIRAALRAPVADAGLDALDAFAQMMEFADKGENWADVLDSARYVIRTDGLATLRARLAAATPTEPPADSLTSTDQLEAEQRGQAIPFARVNGDGFTPEQQKAIDVDELRRQHVRDHVIPETCVTDREPWPCITARLLDLIGAEAVPHG